MPPARPYWKGYLKLALVSCPIALYSAASSSERVAFRQINKKTGNRLRQQLVDEVTREPVESHDKGRGYEYSKNAYIPVEDEELDAVALESNHTIEIDKFVPRNQIDERYLDSPYYLIPNDNIGQEAFAVIREANVWDNAAMESFFSSLKTERTARKTYRTRDEAKADVFDYIECFYNPKRRHSTIGYLSPVEFEMQAGFA